MRQILRGGKTRFARAFSLLNKLVILSNRITNRSMPGDTPNHHTEGEELLKIRDKVLLKPLSLTKHASNGHEMA